MSELETYQKDVLRYIKTSKLNGIYLYHNFLSDYVRLSLLISYIKLQDLKANGVIIVSSSIGINVYSKLLKELKLDYKYFELINHYNFEKIANTNLNYCSNKIVIFDKMHYYTNPSKTTHNIINCLGKSKYTVLISSEMLLNKSTDIVTSLAILHKISWKEANELYKASTKDNYISEKLFSGYISYHRPSDNNINIYENNVLVNMSDNVYTKYNVIEKIYLNKKDTEYSGINIFDFLSAFKNELETIGYNSDKFEWILTKLKSESSARTVIYCDKNHQELFNLLKNNDVKCYHINSEASYITRNNIVKSFNQLKSGVLLISSYKKDIPLYISNISNLMVIEPQLNNDLIKGIIDNIILTNNQLNKNSIKKSSQKANLYIYTLLIKKPSTSNLLQKLKEYFIYNKVLSIDQWYQDIIDTNKKYMKILLKKVKYFAIEKEFK